MTREQAERVRRIVLALSPPAQREDWVRAAPHPPGGDGDWHVSINAAFQIGDLEQLLTYLELAVGVIRFG